MTIRRPSMTRPLGGALSVPAALALLSAGALGNLIDRLRHAKGVVDFIDVGTAEWRFWTFNVADMGVSIGAVLLAYLLWREGPSPSDHPAVPLAQPVPVVPADHPNPESHR